MSELEREEEVVEALKRSKERVNYVYPVIIDSATGEIVDGRHRKRADPTWPEKKVEFKDEIEKILFRIHANIARRKVSRRERAFEFARLASALERSGVPTEQICQKIVELVPWFDESYIMRLLPSKYKQKKKREAAVRAVYKRAERKAKGEKAEAEKAKVKPKEKFYTCPVCGSKLVLKGDLLWPARS